MNNDIEQNNEKLAEILRQDNSPEIDINARKRAVNLSIAEFKTAQNEKNKKSSQGLSLLHRLMGINHHVTGANTMKKKHIYAGAATAMVLVLVGGLSLTQLDQTIDDFGKKSTVLSQISSPVLTESFSTGDIDGGKQTKGTENKFSMVAENTSSSKPVSPKSLLKVSEQDDVRMEAQKGGVVGLHTMNTIDSVASARVMPGVQMEQRIRPELQSRDKFESVTTNSFKQVATEPVSTFSSDVDTASYAFVRKSINSGRLPSAEQIRSEEMINYFDYNYAVPETKEEPFKPSVTITDSPWHKGRKLMHIGIKGYEVDKDAMHSNLVFLLDVSGSMSQPDKLPLVKSSMNLLLNTLNPDDTVSIVTYAGHTGVTLEPTKVSEKAKIISAMNNLNSGGGTAGAAGIRLAYDMAEQNFNKEATNRIILATDGDFNVGITDRDQLKQYVEDKREKGIFLSVLGFGQGNYNDHMMQTLAQNGNGIAAYIDTLKEAQKVLVQEATSSLFPIAKDVKFQVEFNPAKVAEYRLIGYETRALNREDFNNDKVDAGDIGSGHTVTAIYEFVPVGSDALTSDSLRYGEKSTELIEPTDEYAFVKIRYKQPKKDTSKLITEPVTSVNEQATLPEDVSFSIAVAAFAQKMQGSTYITDMSYDTIINMAQANKGEDQFGYRTEFIQMVRMAKSLQR